MKLHKLLAVVLLPTMLITSATQTTVAAQPREAIYSNAKQIKLDFKVYDSIIYVSLDRLFDGLNVEKGINHDDGLIWTAYRGVKYTINAKTTSLYKNGYPIKLNEPVIKNSDGYYLPLEFISEMFGEPKLDQEDQKIIVDVIESPMNTYEKIIIDGVDVNSKIFDIKSNEDLFFGSAFYRKNLEFSEKQIVALKNKYVLKDTYKKGEFSPYAWLSDIRQVVLYGQKFGFKEAKPIIDDMYNFISHFMVEEGEKLYLAYPFYHEIYNQVHEKGWNSALGNGQIMWGLMYAYINTNDQKYKTMADKLVNAFLDVRDDNSNNWITFVDENGYLWLEEYPDKDGPQTRVLNGHMGAAEALYAYYLYTKNDDVLKLIQSAATTIHHYIEDYRIPNNIHAYSLYTDAVPDYGQKRNLNQLEFLYKITNDPYFLFMRSKFDNDYRRSGKKIQ